MAFAPSLAGQQVPAGNDIATPADTAAVIYDLARDFEANGQPEIATALYNLIVERFAGTAAARNAGLRLNLLAAAPSAESGRTELMVWGALYGLWMGIAVPGSLGVDDAEAYGLGLLVGAPTGLFISHRYSQARFIGEGEASVLSWGGTWGTWQGIGWQAVLDIGIETSRICTTGASPFCYEDTENRTEELFAAGILGGLVGLGVSEFLVRRGDISPGAATLVNFGSLWGTYYGISAGLLADAHDDAFLTWVLLGGDLGLASMALLAPDIQVSQTRARLINITGVAGGLAGLGLNLLVQPSNDQVAIVIPMVTSAIGLGAGVYLTGDDAKARAEPVEAPRPR